MTKSRDEILVRDRERSRLYRQRPGNKERAIDCRKMYDNKHKEKHRERSARYYQKNKEKILQRVRVYARRIRDERNQRFNKILEESGCVDCGMKDTRCLQFHHNDPKTKKYSPRHTRLNWPRVLEEMKMCTILCANCHLTRHHKKR